MDPRFDQALLQPQEDEEEQQQQQQQHQLDVRNERNIIKFPNIKQLKSFEILNSAVKYFTSNTKFMSLMILSILPFFAFIVFYEIHILDAIDATLSFLVPTYTPPHLVPRHIYRVISIEEEISQTGTIIRDGGDDMSYDIGDYNNSLLSTTDLMRVTLGIVFELIPFYLILLPLLELFSLTVVINITAKIYAGNTESTTLKETFTNFKGPFITSLWVQLFSGSTIFGLIWAVANHSIITNDFDYHYMYESFLAGNIYVNLLSIMFHTLISLVLLYKYLDCSGLWNMAIVISALEGETGLDAVEMSIFYQRHWHCKRTGFQLMLMFFVYIVALRLPILLARMCNFVPVEMVVTAIVVVLVCLGSLVKWVAIVLYFYDCKEQEMLKKVDDEDVGQAMKVGDVCNV